MIKKQQILIIIICGLSILMGRDKALVSSWEFRKMTSVFFSDPKEETIQVSNENHREVLNFRSDGTFSHRGVSEGVDVAGIGTWNTSGSMVLISTSGSKIEGQYTISDDMLMLTIDEEETDEHYASKTLITYSRKVNKK